MRKIPHKLLLFYVVVVLICFGILRISKLDFFAADTGSSTSQITLWSGANTYSPLSLLQRVSESRKLTCSANNNTTIPSDIPASLENFLRYRHCRRFPTLLQPSPCENDLYLLFVIKSEPLHVERRAALRDTWGWQGRIHGRMVKLVFLVGRSTDRNFQSVLRWENNHYRDILQWDFEDNFYNLTLKEIGFLHWFSSSCSSAQFVFKGDDDVFMNSENIIDFLEAHKPETPMLTGFIFNIAYPIRNRNSKYFVPTEMYPKSQYPPFMSGGGYVMSRQTVLSLTLTCESVTRFPLDDVFLGMCLERMGLRLTHHKGFFTFGFGSAGMSNDPCVYRGIMLVHKLTPGELRTMWALVQDNTFTCRNMNT